MQAADADAAVVDAKAIAEADSSHPKGD